MTDRDRELIKQFANDGDTSPFYHSAATFRITAPLPVKIQLTRHNVWVFRAERSKSPLHQQAYPGAFAGGVATCQS